jgi:glucose-1-phosphate cytidylyltransferase
MKVVLFCGGIGLRIRAAAPTLPKPIVPIGGRPILWHIMRYYAHFGHRDFILCLGYKGDVIRDYFARLPRGGSEDWNITYVDGGVEANVGQRLRAVRPYVEGERMFLANYADTLTDVPLPEVVDRLASSLATAAFVCARPSYTFHMVSFADDGRVGDLIDVGKADIWINGGYFAFRPKIFDYIEDGEDLVEEPFRRLVQRGELLAYPYEGFWLPMDTLKEKQALDVLAASDPAPWEVWKPPERHAAAAMTAP